MTGPVADPMKMSINSINANRNQFMLDDPIKIGITSVSLPKVNGN
jgi:hypothetical protein